VTRPLPELDPYAHDPDRWGTSLAQSAEIMLPCLDAAGVQTIVEVGAFAGALTRVLVAWAAGSGARVIAIDPAPRDDLVALEREAPGLELIRATSLDALPRISKPDAVVIDGDHNYFTVREELHLISERAPRAELPLLLIHDVSWPHGRRDDYFAPEAIPEAMRQPLAGERGGLHPGDPGLRAGGLPYPRSAAREGGPRNGVLTAVEDFAADRAELRVAVVPAFFGLGVVWHRDAAWADAVARIVDPWDRNPVLERLEANRVHHLAERQAARVELWQEREGRARRDAVLRRLLESRAFSVAERLSRLRVRARIAPEASVVSKDEIRRALADGD
jgi:hypothetical protein